MRILSSSQALLNARYDAAKFRRDLKDTVWGFVEGHVDCIDNFLCGKIFLKKARKTKQCTHSLSIIGCFSIFGFREVISRFICSSFREFFCPTIHLSVYWMI